MRIASICGISHNYSCMYRSISVVAHLLVVAIYLQHSMCTLLFLACSILPHDCVSHTRHASSIPHMHYLALFMLPNTPHASCISYTICVKRKAPCFRLHRFLGPLLRAAACRVAKPSAPPAQAVPARCLQAPPARPVPARCLQAPPARAVPVRCLQAPPARAVPARCLQAPPA